MRHQYRGILLALLGLLSGCGQQSAQGGRAGAPDDGAKQLNVYNWADFIAPDTLSSFEQETGIKVSMSYFDSNDTLETRMLTGHSGYDVSFPSDGFFKREIASGAYLRLDKQKLPNLSHLDPELMARAVQNDPDNAHGVIYVWGTAGLGYDPRRVGAALPGIPLNSWRVLFDPLLAQKLAPCGINLINEPSVVVPIALRYLGKDPATPGPEDFAAVEQLLRGIRAYIRTFETSGDIAAFVNQEICLSLGYGGDVLFANQRAREANSSVQIEYVIPDEGSLLWFTAAAIPADAPHAENAHRFLDYLMRPQVMAGITNAIGYASANRDATPLLNPGVADNPILYPTAAERARLFVISYDAEQSRAITRLWQRFKTGT